MILFPPRGTRVALYGRSASAPHGGKPVDEQLGHCSAYAQQQGWVIVDAYADAPGSGATFVGREDFFRMMAAADRGEFDLVLVDHLDRLSRKAGDVLSIIEDLDLLNIKVCTVASGMTFDFAVTFQVIQSDLYIEQQVVQVHGNQKGVVRRRPISSSVVRGYEPNENSHRTVQGAAE